MFLLHNHRSFKSWRSISALRNLVTLLLFMQRRVINNLTRSAILMKRRRWELILDLRSSILILALRSIRTFLGNSYCILRHVECLEWSRIWTAINVHIVLSIGSGLGAFHIHLTSDYNFGGSFASYVLRITLDELFDSWVDFCIWGVQTVRVCINLSFRFLAALVWLKSTIRVLNEKLIFGNFAYI